MWRWFRWVLLGMVLIIVAGALFLTKPNNGGIASVGLAPKCPADLSGLFTKPMVDTDKLAAITPLGNINGMDHILPVDHLYFQAKPNTGRHETYAPADMRITNLTHHHVKFSSGDNTDSDEYYYEAEICHGLEIWVSGLGELSPELKQVFDSSKKQHSETGANDNEKIINDYLGLNYKVKAGDLLGYAGTEKQWASIEITAMNNNKTEPGVDWSYYGDAERKKGVICPLDLYSGSLKTDLYNLLGTMDDSAVSKEEWEKAKAEGVTATSAVFKPRTVEPRCGTIFQNIAGTIQGDWFYGKPKKDENLESLGRVLTFIHLNTDPSKGVLSVAGTITARPFASIFEPKHTGTVDREPSEVKVDGQTYCYNTATMVGTEGKVLVQLVDDHHLKIEHLSGECAQNEVFNKPFTYER